MHNSKEPLWTRDFVLHWLAYFLMAASFYFLLPTLPVFAVEALHADHGQVGYLIGIYAFSSVAIRPFAGWALDAVGRKAVYVVALGTFALFNSSYVFAGSLAFLFTLRLLHGLSWGATTSGGGTIVADLVPASRRGEGLGHFGLAMAIAMAIGPLVGLKLMGDGAFNRLFLASGALAVLAFLVAMGVNPPYVPPVKRKIAWQTFFEGRVSHICVVMLLSTTVYGGIVSFIALYCETIGARSTGLFFLVYALSVSGVRLLAGKAIDRRGPTAVILAGYVCLVLGFFLLARSDGVAGLVVSALLIGAGNANVWLTLQTMVFNMVAPHRRGVASATFFSAIDAGIGLGSVVLGWVAERTSIGTMYASSALFLLLPLAYYLLVARRDYNTKILQ